MPRLPVTPVYVLPSDAGRAFFFGASVAQALPPEKKFAGHVTLVAAQKVFAVTVLPRWPSFTLFLFTVQALARYNKYMYMRVRIQTILVA